jgi:hypothetical protein
MRILRIVGSQALPCGCLVGHYELYSGQIVRLIDYHSETCPLASHRVNSVLPDMVMEAPSLDHTEHRVAS